LGMKPSVALKRVNRLSNACVESSDKGSIRLVSLVFSIIFNSPFKGQKRR
jgi:hypothetical protein